MYKSTIVSFEAMQQYAPGFRITEKDDHFYVDLTAFSPLHVRVGWSNHLIMAQPGALAPIIPTYSDPFDAVLSQLDCRYANSFIELSPIMLINRLNQEVKFHFCDTNECNYLLVKIHWPASTPPINDEEFRALCQRLNTIASARILPSDPNPCGIDHLILSVYALENSGLIIKHLNEQSAAELVVIDRAWRRYEAEAPFYKQHITQIIQSDTNLSRRFRIHEEYVTEASHPHSPHIDLHRVLWYDTDTMQKVLYAKIGEDRLLSTIFGNLY